MPAREKTNSIVVEYTGVNKVLVGLIIAAVIAWIVFVAKAGQNNVLGNNTIDYNALTENQDQGITNLQTATVCFPAIVATTLVYFVFRHYMHHE